MFETIKVKEVDEIAFIKINRPEVLNALNELCLSEIKQAINVIRHKDLIKAVVFTGSGEKAFVAGADIDELNKQSFNNAIHNDYQSLFNEIEMYEKPTIAMVNGLALGGGCELALACDIRIASHNAKFALPELNLSILPGAGGTQRLSQIIGGGRAFHMILTGDMINADTAKEFGLVSDVVPLEELETRTIKMIEKIIVKGPIAIQLAKLAVRSSINAHFNDKYVIERLAQAVLFTTEDKKEGIAAFLEKRKPNFKNK